MTRQSDCFFELKCEICFAISLSEMIISALSGLSCGGDGRGAGSRPGVPPPHSRSEASVSFDACGREGLAYPRCRAQCLQAHRDWAHSACP